MDSNSRPGSDGENDEIGIERVQRESSYNVATGKAIFDDATRQANHYFNELGVVPTTDELARESCFLYNHSPGFYKEVQPLAPDGRGMWITTMSGVLCIDD